MSQAGCIGVNIGVESGSDRVRKLMAKPSKINQVDSCITSLVSNGIKVSINLMVGYPGEEESDFKETINFVKKHSAQLVAVKAGKTAIFKGTPLFQQIDSIGISLNGEQSRDFVFNRWRLKDNSNNYEIRTNRLMRLNHYLCRLGLRTDSANNK